MLLSCVPGYLPVDTAGHGAKRTIRLPDALYHRGQQGQPDEGRRGTRAAFRETRRGNLPVHTAGRRGKPLRQGPVPGASDEHDERELLDRAEADQLQIHGRPAENRNPVLHQQCCTRKRIIGKSNKSTEVMFLPLFELVFDGSLDYETVNI